MAHKVLMSAPPGHPVRVLANGNHLVVDEATQTAEVWDYDVPLAKKEGFTWPKAPEPPPEPEAPKRAKKGDAE